MKAILICTLIFLSYFAHSNSEVRRAIASTYCYKYFMDSAPYKWEREELKQYVAHPRLEMRDGRLFERTHDDIVALNNDLPVTSFAYFDKNYQVIKKFEDWEKSAGIKLPNGDSQIILTAADINPDKVFHYNQQGLKIDSFTDEGVYFLNFESPAGFPVYREKLIAVDMLREKMALDNNMAMVFKFNDQTYSLMDLNHLESLSSKHPFYEALGSMKNRFLEFFINVYNERFSLDTKFIALLKDVSEFLKGRTVTLLHLDHLTSFKDQSVSLLKDAEIKGSFSFVISRNPDELLPYELTNKLVKERKLGSKDAAAINFQRDPNKTYAEFSRLSVDKTVASLEATADIIKLAAASAKGYKIDEMLIYVDPFHKRLFKKFGFEEVEKYTDAFDETFYIMNATPENVLRYVMEFYHMLKHDPDEMIKLINEKYKRN